MVGARIGEIDCVGDLRAIGGRVRGGGVVWRGLDETGAGKAGDVVSGSPLVNDRRNRGIGRGGKVFRLNADGACVFHQLPECRQGEKNEGCCGEQRLGEEGHLEKD